MYTIGQVGINFTGRKDYKLGQVSIYFAVSKDVPTECQLNSTCELHLQ